MVLQTLQTRAPAGESTHRLGPGRALLVVDMQNDFFDQPQGSLPVPGSARLLPLVNNLIRRAAAAGAFVAASKDWHPADHISFASSHEGKQTGNTVKVPLPAGTRQQSSSSSSGGSGTPQLVTLTLFPAHCVGGTPGAEFADGLETAGIQHIVHKGTQSGLESFSAFYDMARGSSTDLASTLREAGTSTVFVCGVATEYCVRATVLDCLAEDFCTVLLTDAVAGVDAEASQQAIEEMRQAGALLLSAGELLSREEANADTTSVAAAPGADKKPSPSQPGLVDTAGVRSAGGVNGVASSKPPDAGVAKPAPACKAEASAAESGTQPSLPPASCEQ